MKGKPNKGGFRSTGSVDKKSMASDKANAWAGRIPRTTGGKVTPSKAGC